MEEIFTVKYAVDFLIEKEKNLKKNEIMFLESLINKNTKYLYLSEKQKKWYLSILEKNYFAYILKGSIGEKMLMKKDINNISEIELNHIKTYGDVFNYNENIIKQLCD